MARFAIGLVEPHRGSEPPGQIRCLLRTGPHHPGDLVPPWHARRVDEPGRDEKRRRDAFGPENRERHLIVIPIPVVEGEEDVSPPPSGQHVWQIVRGDDVEMGLAEADLIDEGVAGRTPQPAVEHRPVAIADAVVVEDQHTGPLENPPNQGAQSSTAQHGGVQRRSHRSPLPGISDRRPRRVILATSRTERPVAARSVGRHTCTPISRFSEVARRFL